jgi:hypothetical protein
LIEYHYLPSTRDEKLEKEFQMIINKEEYLVSFVPLTTNHSSHHFLHSLSSPSQSIVNRQQQHASSPIDWDEAEFAITAQQTPPTINKHEFISVTINGMKRNYCCYKDEHSQPDLIYVHCPTVGTQLVRKIPRLKVSDKKTLYI